MILASKSKGAVLVGIAKYKNPAWNLRGPENDIETMQALLSGIYGFRNFLILKNDEATKKNILDSLSWLGQYETRVFYDSSHGTRLPLVSGDDTDWTECIITYDHSWDSPLIDDELSSAFSKFAQSGRTYIIYDCCHAQGMAKILSPLLVLKYIECPCKYDLYKFRLVKPKSISSVNENYLYACQNNESAAETPIGGKWQGVFTFSLSISLQTPISLIALEEKTRKITQGYSTQTPVIEPKTNRIALT